MFCQYSISRLMGEDKAGSWEFADECGDWRSLFVFRREWVLWAWIEGAAESPASFDFAKPGD